MATAISPITVISPLGFVGLRHEAPPPASQPGGDRCTVLACDLEHRDNLEQTLSGERLFALAPGQDPIAAISAWLQGSPSQELHVVAHGAPGQIQLGSGIDRMGLLQQAEQIGRWGVERIYLWSCSVGADLAFVSALQELSGARVFASAEPLGLGRALMGSNFPELAAGVAALPLELGDENKLDGNCGTIEQIKGTDSGILERITNLTALDSAAKLSGANFLEDKLLFVDTISANDGGNVSLTAAELGSRQVTLGDGIFTVSGSVSQINTLNSSLAASTGLDVLVVEDSPSKLNAANFGSSNLQYVDRISASNSGTEVSFDASELGSRAVVLEKGNFKVSGTAAQLQELNATGIDAIAVSGAASIAQLASIDANTTGTLTYSSISDTAANLTANAGGYVTGDKAVAVTGAASIAQLASIDANTTGTLTYGSISDTAANLSANAGGYVTGDKAVAVTGAASIAQLASIDANTTGTLTYGSISDTAANLSANAGGYVTGDKAVAVTGAASIAQLASIDANTTGALTYSSISDTAANLTANAGGYVTGDKAVAVTSSEATAAQINIIDGYTTSTIDASAVKEITGDSADLKTLYTSSGVTGLGNIGIIVSDASVNAADLNTLDGKTNVNINAASVGTLTGTASAIDTAINASTINTGAAVLVNINDGNATVAQANSIDAQTTGVVTATISDTSISTLSGLSGTGNAYSITVSDASVNAADLNTLDGKTIIAIDANAINSISGTAAEVTAAFNSTGIDNLNAGSDSISVSDTTLSGVNLTALDAGEGTDELTSSNTSADTLNVSEANKGTLGNVAFSNLENVTLGSGNDNATIATGASLQNLDAGAGTDTLDTNTSDNTLVINADSRGTVDGTAFSSFETINTLDGSDSVTVNSSAAALNLDTGDGNDSLTSNTSADTLNVSEANKGTLGNVAFSNLENVTLGSGNDNAILQSGAALVSLNGGDGSDTLNLKGSGGYDITLTGNDEGEVKELGMTSSTAFSSFENIYAGSGDDTLTIKEGASLSGKLDLGDGSNTVTVEGATLEDAVIQGGIGADTMTFDAPAPTNGASGSVTAYIDAGAGDDTIQIRGGFLPIGSSTNSSPKTILGSAISDLKQTLQDAAKSGALSDAAAQAGIDNSASNKTELSRIIQNFQSGDFAGLPNFKLVTASDDMNGALAAYISETNTIAVDQNWLKDASNADINSVLAEEVGHYLDETVNTIDTEGDEGQAFSEALLGYRTSGTTGENRGDATVEITLDGKEYSAEANNSIPMAGENFRPNLVIQGGLGNDTVNLDNEIDLADAADFARSGGFGEFINYAADPTGETLSSEFLSTKFSGFEEASWDKTSQDTASVSDVSLMGVQDTTVSSGADLSMVYGIAANSAATTSSVDDGVSAYGAGLSLGIEDSNFAAGDALSMTVSFGGSSSADAQSVASAADAVAVSYGVGLDTTELSAGSSLNLVIKDSSAVEADALSTLGGVFAVASNDGIGATDLIAIGDSAVDAVFSLNLTNSATALTTEGSAEAVGWLGASTLANSEIHSGGIGLINIAATGLNAVSAESVSGPAIADAFSAMAGVNNTSFDFADTNSAIASSITNTSSASSNSILGNALSGLKSTVFGLFGGSNGGETIDNAQSVSSIISDHGFAESASVGGMASSIASQSVNGISGYEITTTDNLLLHSKNTVDSTASSSVSDA